MRRHQLQVLALLRGEAVDIDGGMAQLLASPGLLPDRPIRTPLLLAAQCPKGRAVAKEIADGLLALRDPGLGFDPCLVSANGTVLDPGEAATSRRVRAAVRHFSAQSTMARWHAIPRRSGACPTGRLGSTA